MMAYSQMEENKMENNNKIEQTNVNNEPAAVEEQTEGLFTRIGNKIDGSAPVRFVKKHKKKIAIGAGLLGAGGLLYLKNKASGESADDGDESIEDICDTSADFGTDE